jgi:hypothetical protein
MNHGVSLVVKHAGIPVGNLGNTIGFYHGNDGFRHGFLGRFPTGYRRDSRRALESCRVQESCQFYLHRVESTSALYKVTKTCWDTSEEFYQKLERPKTRGDRKFMGIVDRVKWPLSKEDYQGVLVSLQRYTHAFQFVLDLENRLVSHPRLRPP